MRDPRSSRRYRTLRAQYIADHQGAPALCALCATPVDTTLPGTHPDGPTVEHGVPVRQLRRMAHDWDHLVALTCDTSTWSGIAHKRCQDAQGARAVNGTGKPTAGLLGTPSRVW